MPVQHHKQTFSVGSNDKQAAQRYELRFDHSMGKCGGDCWICRMEQGREREAVNRMTTVKRMGNLVVRMVREYERGR